MANEKRLIDVQMDENDANAETVGGFLKTLLLHLWEEGEGFSGKRPFGNGGWQFQVYASLIKAGYEIGKLDEDGYVDDVDYAKADKLIMDAISEVFTVDAVEVVRCKDCAVPHNKWTGCPKLSGLVPPPDFYCAYGERKDNA